MKCECRFGGDVMPTVNGKHFLCESCEGPFIGSCTSVFHWVHDDTYGCLLVCNACGTEYQTS